MRYGPYIYKETEAAIESVCVNGVSVLSGLNLEKTYGLSFLRDSKLPYLPVIKVCIIHG